MPLQLVERLHMAGKLDQIALCATAAVILVLAFGFRRPADELDHFGPSFRTVTFSDVSSNVMRIAVRALVLVGILELAQLLTPDRTARITDLLDNSLGVIVAASLVVAVLVGTRVARRL